APFVQAVHGGGTAPARRDEAHPAHDQEQDGGDDELGGVPAGHRSVLLRDGGGGCGGVARRTPCHQVDEGRGADPEDDERELQPVEERESGKPRLVPVEQERQERNDDRDDEQPVPGTAVAPASSGLCVSQRSSSYANA